MMKTRFWTMKPQMIQTMKTNNTCSYGNKKDPPLCDGGGSFGIGDAYFPIAGAHHVMRHFQRFVCFWGILLLVSVLAVSSCAIHVWKPVQKQGYGSEKSYAIVTYESLLVAIRPQAYSGSANKVSTSFFPVWIQVRNLGKSAVSLNRNSFGIIAKGTQYDPIPMEYILGSLQTDYLLQDYEDPFSSDPFAIQNRQESGEKYSQAYLELLNSCFSFGDILPGGMKEGYLFYNSKVSSSKVITIDVLGTEVEFVR